MTRQILFVQGAGDGAHDRWDNRLVASLARELGESYDIRYPRMPAEDDPGYSAWKTVLMEEFKSLKDGAILVGHSVGGTFLIHALAELQSETRFGGLFVISAPFIGEGGWPGDDFKEVSGHRLRGIPIYLYHGAEDTIVPAAHVRLHAQMMPHAAVRIIDGRDHQLNDDMSHIAADIRSLR